MKIKPFNLHCVMWISCLFFLITFPPYAQGQRGVLVLGRVFLPNNRPAIRMTVNITGQNGYSSSTKTDERGGFRFDEIPRTIYSLTLTTPKDTKHFADPVSVNATADGNNFTVDIFMRDPLEAAEKKEKQAHIISVREASQNIPKDARKAFDKAQKYREQKKFDAALNELDKAISIYPDYFQAVAEKGIVQINAGKLKEALQHFGKAIDMYSEYEPAFSGVGYCLVNLGYYERALPFLEKSVQLNPIHAQNLLFMGIANLALSRWQKAQEPLEKVLKLDTPESVTAHMYLAEALAGQKLYNRAADELQTYLKLNPNTPNAERLRQREKYYRSQKTQ